MDLRKHLNSLNLKFFSPRVDISFDVINSRLSDGEVVSSFGEMVGPFWVFVDSNGDIVWSFDGNKDSFWNLVGQPSPYNSSMFGMDDTCFLHSIFILTPVILTESSLTMAFKWSDFRKNQQLWALLRVLSLRHLNLVKVYSPTFEFVQHNSISLLSKSDMERLRQKDLNLLCSQ